MNYYCRFYYLDWHNCSNPWIWPACSKRFQHLWDRQTADKVIPMWRIAASFAPQQKSVCRTYRRFRWGQWWPRRPSCHSWDPRSAALPSSSSAASSPTPCRPAAASINRTDFIYIVVSPTPCRPAAASINRTDFIYIVVSPTPCRPAAASINRTDFIYIVVSPTPCRPAAASINRTDFIYIVVSPTPCRPAAASINRTDFIYIVVLLLSIEQISFILWCRPRHVGLQLLL